MTPKYVVEKSNTGTLQSSPSPGAVARGFGQTFGLLPSIAFLTLATDSMLFAGEVGTMGWSLPFSCATGAALGFITFLAQRKWYQDDNEAAAIKGLILAFLIAIPSPLPGILYVPCGIVGLVHGLRRK